MSAARIWVTWTAPGFHYFPGLNNGAEKLYLHTSHRHLFGFTVALDVHDDDREVEFHDLLAHCMAFTADKQTGESWGPLSCEAIARALAAHVEDRWPDRNPEVTVSEDGECGAIVK
jgi:hypothetical protein